MKIEKTIKLSPQDVVMVEMSRVKLNEIFKRKRLLEEGKVIEDNRARIIIENILVELCRKYKVSYYNEVPIINEETNELIYFTEE